MVTDIHEDAGLAVRQIRAQFLVEELGDFPIVHFKLSTSEALAVLHSKSDPARSPVIGAILARDAEVG